MKVYEDSLRYCVMWKLEKVPGTCTALADLGGNTA